LSAALFLAKNGHDVMVFGTNETAMHYAYLHNYLGAPDISGTDFQRIARDQVVAHGASVSDERVLAIAVDEDSFRIETGAGSHRCDYLVMSEGKNPELALSLGVAGGDAGIQVDAHYRSSVDRVYVVGRSARPARSQAIISAGAGAAAALDILSTEAGKDVQDWDTPPKTEG
jgi:thioredoxin reductase